VTKAGKSVKKAQHSNQTKIADAHGNEILLNLEEMESGFT